MRNEDIKNLLHRKKFYLVLDLNHTLLNSTKHRDMTSEEENLKSQIDSLQGIFVTFIFDYSLEVYLAFLISMFSGTMVTFLLCLYDDL